MDLARRMKRLESEDSRLKRAVTDLTLDQILKERSDGDLRALQRRRQCVDHPKETSGVAERRAHRCWVAPRVHSALRAEPADDENAMIEEIVELAR